MPQPPRYLVDYESIAYGRIDPLLVVEELVDRTAHPNFWRDGCCRTCEHWHGKGRPSRPFAENPLGPEGGCDGCVLSHLDENPAWLAERAEELRQRTRPAPRPRRTRVTLVRYERGKIVEAS